jgi:hypothetical protein
MNPTHSAAGVAPAPARETSWPASRFFRSGRRILATLQQLCDALKSGKPDLFGSLFARAYGGDELGFQNPVLVAETGGVREYRFQPRAGKVDSQGAIAEWRDYQQCFCEVEEAKFSVERLEKWKGDELVAIVRMEIIGRLRPETRSSVDRALLRLGFASEGESLRISGATMLQGERVACDCAQFINVAHQAGIDFRSRYYPEFLNQPLKFGMIRYGPGGITAVDYDNDGWYDLFIPDGVESRLFHNRRDGTFEDVTARAGLGGLCGVNVAVFADYDNDGCKDLFVSRTFDHNQLFHNNGDGTFTDVTAGSGIGEDCCATVAAWGDYNHDGLLDLYVGRYIDPRKNIPTTPFYSRNGEANQLYRNNGDGTFTNVTPEACVGDTGLTLGAVWGDFDDDGLPDLFVANDFGRNTLYHNNGDGTFSDVTVRAGTLAYGAGMNTSFADFDNDGRFDLYVTHIRSDHVWLASAAMLRQFMVNCVREGEWRSAWRLYWQLLRQSRGKLVGAFRQMASGNNLLRNRGDGTFEDVTEKTGTNPPGWFWGAVFGDFSNRGWQDIYAANGWIYGERDTELELQFLAEAFSQRDYSGGRLFNPENFGSNSWHGWERNRFLRNNGNSTFTEIGHGNGSDLLLNSRGVAIADFWNRGVLDIAVAASDDRHALLRNNLASGRHWLQVELRGTRSNRDAVGARVTIRSRGQLQAREVTLGDGYASQSSLRLHFGLDDAPSVDELQVRWPKSGIVQRFDNVTADRIIAIVEGNPAIVEKRYAKGRP